MDQIWAPWRLAYVTASKPPADQDPCFICQGLAKQDDRSHLIALRTPLCVVLLNRFPYNNGHLLVAPNAHKGELHELEANEILELQQTIARLVEVLREMMNSDGFNIGLNLGKAAGAGLPGHLHWHLVPRWNGDTNFMPVVADTKVISQSLESLYDLIVGRVSVRQN